MYYVMTYIFKDKMTKVYQGTLKDCIDYVDEDTDIYFIMDEDTDIYFIIDENNNIIEP